MQDGTDRSVKEALGKKAAYGRDIDLDDYVNDDTQTKIDDLTKMDKDTKTVMENVGVIADEGGRAGTIMFINNRVSHCSVKEQEGLIMIPLSEALKKYDWVKDYYWKSMDPTKDKYTAKAYLDNADGYFIYVEKGHRIKDPIQSCMMIGTKKGAQTLHNIIIVDEGASLELITGCATGSHINEGLHVGVSEIYVKDNASITFSMIHNWGTKTMVRPRTNCVLGRNSKYVNNYVLLEPVGSLQSFPTCYLNGEGASCKFNTVCLAQKESDIDIGGAAVLNAPGTSAEIMSRSVCSGGKIIARGRLTGNATGAKAHLECRSIMLNDEGSTLAIPELEATVADVEMTHEAAVGKIARDQIEYLMSRGLSEDDAVSMIIRGFLVGSINGLPENLRREIDEAVNKANLGN